LISAVFAALILFYGRPCAASLPLTETIMTLPEGKVDFRVGGEFFTHGNGFRRECVSVSLGVLPSLTVSIYLHYLHQGYFANRDHELGDSFLRLSFFIGDYLDASLHIAFLTLFRFPTGSNAYTREKWRNLSLGNNELKMGPVFQIDIGRLYVHANVFYVFRERNQEGFYNTFYVNIFEKETWQKVFGLNFMAKDTFLEGDRLKNDYAIASLALVTDLLYPLVPSAELYTSQRVYRDKNDPDRAILIEGCGVNPMLLSFGMRYFFSYSSFLGVYCTYNPLRKPGFLREIYGLTASIQF